MSSTNTSKTDRRFLLTDPTRRRICLILTSPDPPVSERDLAVELATRCLNTPPAAISDTERRRYLIQLHHHQLPKLAAHGLITYDRSTQTVSITAAGCDALEAVMRTPQEPPVAVPTEA